MIRTLERIMGSPLERINLPDFDYSVPAPHRGGGEARGRGRPQAPRPAPTPKSYGRNRLAPRRRR